MDHQPAGQSSTWSEVNASGEILPARSVIIEGVLYIFGGYGGRTDRLDDFTLSALKKAMKDRDAGRIMVLYGQSWTVEWS